MQNNTSKFLITWQNSLCHSLRRRVGKAVTRWKMIEPGDRVLIGLSGGKDSLLLLHALDDLRKRSPVKFEIAAFTVALTGMNIEPLKNYCDAKNIQYIFFQQPIIEIIKLRNEKSACSFCANMRRGIISSWASQNNFNKLALGHSIDDAAETFLLNIFHAGRAKSFKPVLHMSRTGITVIRPLVLSTEAAIIDEVKRLNLPVIPSACPFAGKTHRQKARDLLSKLNQEIPDLYAKVLNSLENLSDNDSWKEFQE